MPSKKQTNDDYSEADAERMMIERRSKLRRRKYYPTRVGGACVNACTGAAYQWYQGSNDEMRLYKVFEVTGYYDNQGFMSKRKDPQNRDPLILYYDSPEQYKSHTKCNVNQKLIAEWHEKVKQIFPGGRYDEDSYEEWRKNHYAKTMKGYKSGETLRKSISDEEW